MQLITDSCDLQLAFKPSPRLNQPNGRCLIHSPNSSILRLFRQSPQEDNLWSCRPGLRKERTEKVLIKVRGSPNLSQVDRTRHFVTQPRVNHSWFSTFNLKDCDRQTEKSTVCKSLSLSHQAVLSLSLSECLSL